MGEWVCAHARVCMQVHVCVLCVAPLELCIERRKSLSNFWKLNFSVFHISWDYSSVILFLVFTEVLMLRPNMPSPSLGRLPVG